MSNIIGTTILVSAFLKEEEAFLGLDVDSESRCKLPKDRKLFIPYYQREIRWKKENIMTLIQDIVSGEKFLGNIILSKKNQKEYEIVDGQQRITCLIMMLIYFTKNEKYSRSFEFCNFSICSFPKFEWLSSNQFDLSLLTDEQKEELEKNDDYNQKERYVELYKTIVDFFRDKDNRQLSAFYHNLTNSKLNLIISMDENRDLGMDFFLDVNLKTLPLDVEDIFKGYFFKELDNIEEAKKLWSDIKRAYNAFNKIIISKKSEYPLEALLEHYIRSTLHTFKPSYATLEYSKGFKLTKEIKAEKANPTLANCFIGDHLLNVIKDSDYLKSFAKGLVNYLAIVTDVIASESPTDKFKDLFKCAGGARLDNDTITLCHYMIKSVVLGPDSLPKAVIAKYCISVFDGKEKTKAQYKQIFSAFLFSILFSVFGTNKKNIDEVLPILKADSDNWTRKTIEAIQEYFDKTVIEENILLKKFKIDKPTAEMQYLAQSLGGIYNFFRITKDAVEISNEGQAKEFYKNNTDYSREHFFLNEKGSVHFYNSKGKKDGKLFRYPTEIRQARNSLFNFVFLPKKINLKLENLDFITKFSVLEKEEIKCEYSKKLLDLAQEEFKNIKLNRTNIEGFFAEEFIKGYKNVAEAIMKEVISKCREKVK